MLSEAIRQAQKMHRKAIEETYDGTCNVYAKEPVRDPETGVTSMREVPTIEGQPCHLSFSGAGPAMKTGTVTNVPQSIKLFLAPEVIIEPGSRIEVTQQKHTECYSRSGKAAVYSSHQEILLELWNGFA